MSNDQYNGCKKYNRDTNKYRQVSQENCYFKEKTFSIIFTLLLLPQYNVDGGIDGIDGNVYKLCRHHAPNSEWIIVKMNSGIPILDCLDMSW